MENKPILNKDCFEWMICSKKNGITVYNRVMTEDKGYKLIAYITEYGKIKLYVPEDKIPPDAMEKIIQAAGKYRAEFFKYWNTLPIEIRYEKLLGALSHHIGNYLEFIGGHNEKTMEQKVSCLENLLYGMGINSR